MKKNDTNYLHAAARVHSLESRLISGKELLRAAEASDPQEAFRILARRGILREFSLKDCEKALDRDLRETYELAERITGNSQITFPFRYPADGHNLKVFAKARVLEENCESLYKETGTFSPEVMREELETERFEKIPRKLGQAALLAAERLARTRDPQACDIRIDKAVLELMREKAREIGNPLLEEYAAAKIDLINLETAVRLLRVKKEAYQIQRVLAPGGTIAPSRITEACSAGYGGIARLAAKTGIAKGLEDSLATFRQGQSLDLFEERLEGCFQELFDKAKLIPFGLEPVIAFLCQKEREVRAVRLILTAKRFGLPGERTGERIRYLYAD